VPEVVEGKLQRADDRESPTPLGVSDPSEGGKG
jgi:hypothetical protein